MEEEDLTKLTDKELNDLIVEHKKLIPQTMGWLYDRVLSAGLKKLEDEKARRQLKGGE